MLDIRRVAIRRPIVRNAVAGLVVVLGATRAVGGRHAIRYGCAHDQPGSCSTTGSTTTPVSPPATRSTNVDPRHLRQHHRGRREVHRVAGTVVGDQPRRRQRPVSCRCRSGTPLDVDRFTVAALIRYTGVENDQTFERWRGPREGRRVLDQHPHRRQGPRRWLLRRLHQPVLEVPRQQRPRPHEHLDPRRQHLQRLHAHRVDQRCTGREHGGQWQDVQQRPSAGRRREEAIPPGRRKRSGTVRLDDIRIYRRALSAAEIRGLLPT